MFDCFIALILADSSFKILMAIDSAVAAKLGNSLVFVYGSLPDDVANDLYITKFLYYHYYNFYK